MVEEMEVVLEEGHVAVEVSVRGTHCASRLRTNELQRQSAARTQTHVYMRLCAARIILIRGTIGRAYQEPGG